MLKGENIIFISSIDWDEAWQIHQELAYTFAKCGNEVLFIENTGMRVPGLRDIPRIKRRFINWLKGLKGLRQQMPGLYVFSPLVLPFPYLRIARFINRFLLLSFLEKWMWTVDFSNPVIYTFLPTGLSLDIIGYLSKKLTIYYCSDNFSASSFSAKKIRGTEEKLLKTSDLVFVTSQQLYGYCSGYNRNVYIFPSGVNMAKFFSETGNEVPQELERIRRPIIGYIGGVHKWLDQELIKSLAKSYPDYSFVFIGPIVTNISLLSGLKNVYFLGQKEHTDLAAYIKTFDIAIIPYVLADYTKNVYPVKLNEYLAMGKAVISKDLPEIKLFNRKYGQIVYVATDVAEFSRCIEKALRKDNKDLMKRRIEIAKENSWENKIEEMSHLIEQAIEKKRLNKDAGWKESMLLLYRKARVRLLKFAVFYLLLYLLIFRTSFIWFLASPLKVESLPAKADAIVVFAGGVGESGKAGQGYEERVQYAVELFRKGYASHLIFSSGYSYVFKEAQVMKLLAVSLGVPEKAIVLEEKATNTYQNVKFTKEILDKHTLKSILLVSSPYHMLRASLTFRKVARHIQVIRTPIPYSRFYTRLDGIRLRQIKGIIHEYLGILYYWWKGYI